MKKQFSTNWKGSIQPRKQRKFRANAPLHIKQKMLSSHLSKDLREKYKRRSCTLRKNDSIKVMSGEYTGKTGKVNLIDLKKNRVAVEGIQITKKDGSKANVYFNCSNLMITELNLDDKKRLQSIQRKTAAKKSADGEK